MLRCSRSGSEPTWQRFSVFFAGSLTSVWKVKLPGALAKTSHGNDTGRKNTEAGHIRRISPKIIPVRPNNIWEPPKTFLLCPFWNAAFKQTVPTTIQAFKCQLASHHFLLPRIVPFQALWTSHAVMALFISRFCQFKPHFLRQTYPRSAEVGRNRNRSGDFDHIKSVGKIRKVSRFCCPSWKTLRKMLDD